jgi:long-chain acyl-CoA synthetase
MSEITAKTPWQDSMGEVPMHLDYFEGSMFEKVEAVAQQYPNNVAFDFMGRATTYRQLIAETERCARALKTIGIRENDRVTIAMPNCPQAIYMFYAVNLIGAVANMIHPLSAEKEIEFYLNESGSVTAITLDQFYNKFENIRKNTSVVNIIIASVKDELSQPLKAGYMLTEGRKIKKIPKDAPVIRWREFMRMSRMCFYNYKVKRKAEDPAVILYSGGTTGTTKGIVLTNLNFNALSRQVVAANPMFRPGDRMLAAMPLFHGFGLGVCIHTMLAQGGRCILIPRFTAKSYARQITKYRCNFIAGVPTLYEALLRLPDMENADLSSLKGVFSGGDSLSVELKKKFDKFLYDHHASIQVREGYGTTETVTACCLTPPHMFKEGSIGVPFPDTYIKIVKPGTDEELPYGEEGEILLAGPTVMREYMNHPEETAQTIRVHADGQRWVYTGDLGTMDEEGFIYFRGRAKRMIITSGYNVYPGQLENILDAHEKVHMSCVIGIPDSYKMQAVKAFIMLREGVPPTEETREEIMAYCRKSIAKYAIPKEIEFRAELPKTLVGKVAYRVLEEEEAAKRAAAQPEPQEAK